MAKENNVFTSNPLGGTPGVSRGMVRNKVPGGTLISPYTQDNVHGVELAGVEADGMNKWGGSDFNLEHSLKGASAVQDHGGRDGKSKPSERKL